MQWLAVLAIHGCERSIMTSEEGTAKVLLLGLNEELAAAFAFKAARRLWHLWAACELPIKLRFHIIEPDLTC